MKATPTFQSVGVSVSLPESHDRPEFGNLEVPSGLDLLWEFQQEKICSLMYLKNELIPWNESENLMC